MSSYDDYRSQVRSTLLAHLRASARTTDNRPRPVGSMTRALKDPNSPLSQHLKQRFPHTPAAAREYSAASGPLRVPRGTTDPGLIGTAFDLALRLLLVPRADVSVAFRGLTARRGLSEAARVLERLPAQLISGSRGAATADDQLLRVAWVLGLGTTVYRTGQTEDSPLSRFRHQQPSADELLALAPVPALEELGQLVELAAKSPISRVATVAQHRVSGPTFGGSRLINADADLILGDMLVETKTSQGGRRSSGAWYSRVEGIDLYQVLVYCLLDFDDSFSLRRLGFYAARYGELKVWAVEDLLEVLSGRHSVDLREERQRLRELLSAPQARRSLSGPARQRLLRSLGEIPMWRVDRRTTEPPPNWPKGS